MVSDRMHDHLNLHLQCEHINILGVEASNLRDEVSVDDGVIGPTETWRWTLDVQLLGTLLVVALLPPSPRPVARTLEVYLADHACHKGITFQNLNSIFVVERKVKNREGSNGVVNDINLSGTYCLKTY